MNTEKAHKENKVIQEKERIFAGPIIFKIVMALRPHRSSILLNKALSEQRLLVSEVGSGASHW